MLRREWLLFCFLFLLVVSAEESDPRPARGSRRVIEVEGGPASVVWVVQFSDLHFSVFHPERALDFARLVGPALAMIKPSLVLVTGDLTDGKSKDLLTMMQNEVEWTEYQKVMTDAIEKSGLDKEIFYDLRGNHDKFGVPEPAGSYDFYEKYSINAGVGRKGNVHSVTLQMSTSSLLVKHLFRDKSITLTSNMLPSREYCYHALWVHNFSDVITKNGRNHLFVGFDSTMEVGLRGPTNLFGHPTDQLLSDIDLELSQWDLERTEFPVTKISFGHFPLSFSTVTESGKSLEDIFLKHSLSAYLCGHLHTKFGKNIKRHHYLGHRFLSSGKFYQLNIHEKSVISYTSNGNCYLDAKPSEEFWEWEMGDWRKNRHMRILAIDAGHVSFVDVDFVSGSQRTIILPTFPVDSQFMQRISSCHDYNCQTDMILSYNVVRALVFSATDIVSVFVKIYDSRPGKLSLVLDSAMKKEQHNETRGDLYVAPWNWRAFANPSPVRYWIQIEAIDIRGRSSFSDLRPFSVNGLIAKVDWKWKEFLVMGVRWASMYQPILWFILLLLFGMLLVPRVFLIYSRTLFTYMSIVHYFYERKIHKLCLHGSVWVLAEFSKLTLIWFSLLVYLLYLTFFPWFSGHIFTKSGHIGYMTHKGWDAKVYTHKSYIGSPDVMVIVLPHLCFVILPATLVMAALAAEKAACRVQFLSLSGKKEDDSIVSNGPSGTASSYRICSPSRRWIRKVILLCCLAILWRHFKSCRSLGKAYEMNPFTHSFVYSFSVPLLVAGAVYNTAAL